MKLNSTQIAREVEDESTMMSHTTSGRRVFSQDESSLKEIHYREHWTKWRSVYHYVERYIRKNVGRSFDDVFSEFLVKAKEDKDIPNQYGFESISQIFRSKIDPTIEGDLKYHHYKEDFYIDDSGIIRCRKKDAPAHHKDRVFIYNGEVSYRLKEIYLPYIGIISDHINRRLGATWAYRCCHETMTPQQFQVIQSLPYYLSDGDLLKTIYESLKAKNRYIYRPDRLEYLFETIKGGEYITKTKNKRIQASAESAQKSRRMKVQSKKQKEEYENNLLHNLLLEQKRKERVANWLKIQAHGFDDETSFRGEEYHGEKRKKKKV